MGQLNLDYVDPDGREQRVLGTIFTINYDTNQRKAITWNQNALSSSSFSTTSSQPPTPTLAPSASLVSTLTNTPTSSTALQSSTSTPPTASAFRRGDLASIVLGTVLGILITALLIMFWIRWQRKKRLLEQEVGMPSAVAPSSNTGSSIQEKDAVTAPNELLGVHQSWELPSDRR